MEQTWRVGVPCVNGSQQVAKGEPMTFHQTVAHFVNPCNTDNFVWGDL